MKNKKLLISFVTLLIMIMLTPCVFAGATVINTNISKKRTSEDYWVGATSPKNWQGAFICGNYIAVCPVKDSNVATLLIFDKDPTPNNVEQSVTTSTAKDVSNSKNTFTYYNYTYRTINDVEKSKTSSRKLRCKVTGLRTHANSVGFDSKRNIILVAATSSITRLFNLDPNTGFVTQAPEAFNRKVTYTKDGKKVSKYPSAVSYDEKNDKFSILYSYGHKLYIATPDDFYSNKELSKMYKNYNINPGGNICKQQTDYYDGYFFYIYISKVLVYDTNYTPSGTKIKSVLHFYENRTSRELEAVSFDRKNGNMYIAFATHVGDYGDYSLKKTEINLDILKKFTITLNGNGGTNGGSYSMLKNAKLGSYLGTLPKPERPGYKFLGWFTDPIGGKKITVDTKVTGNATYYAHWQLLKSGQPVTETVDVILDENGGKELNPSVYEVIKGTTWGAIKVNIPNPVPEDDNPCDRFIGWFTAEEGGNKIADKTKMNADFFAYAHWETVHDIVPAPAGSPTCEEPGYPAHYMCCDCGARFLDAKGNEEVSLDEGIVDEVTDQQIFLIPALGHSLVSVDKIWPTQTTEGMKEHYKCTRCQAKFYDSDATERVENDSDLTIPRQYMNEPPLEPPVVDPPVEDPPVEDPPVVDPPVEDPPVPQVMKGDLDDDGKISIIDVRLMLQWYINSDNPNKPTKEEKELMDMNKDGKINIIDIRLLLQKYIEK